MNWYETEIGSTILQKKYFHEGENFEDFVNRVSSIFSKDLKPKIKEAIYNADFFPAGRSLYGAGSKGKFKATMSNCYVMPMPNDDIGSIYRVAEKVARIASMGGGTGINISNLCPRGAKINNSAKTSTGAVSFIEIYNTTGEIIGSNNRRAALMIGMNCDHPDIEEFLEAKSNNDKIQSANLSILFTDQFMRAVEDNEEFELKFYRPETKECIKKTINARDFFKRFCELQWDYAEPGAIFIDRVRKHNFLSGCPDYQIDICNPCGEFFGNAYNACNLGSINLYNCVIDPFTKDAQVNWGKLHCITKVAIDALDEILDYGAEMQPLEENRKCIEDWRSIGLGVFGLADMYVALGLRYGSRDADKLTDRIFNYISLSAMEESYHLAQKKGAFLQYKPEYFKAFMFNNTKFRPSQEFYEEGIRNGTLMSIAPTGSIGTMCGMSGGIEPLFAISYERTTHALEKTGKTFRVFAKSVEDLLTHHGLSNSNLSDDEIKRRFPFVVTAHDIDPLDRVRTQATIQKYVDNAVSSTVNLKESATAQDIFDIYMTAWKKGCKGLTVFRDNCKRSAILGGQKKRKEKEKSLRRRKIHSVDGTTITKRSACADAMYVTVNKRDNKIFEVFTNSSGGCKSNISTITRLVSLLLRGVTDTDSIIRELKENPCPACQILKKQGQNVSLSCGSCIAEAIEELKGGESEKEISNGIVCPECGQNTLRPEGKCVSCSNCGYSKCD